MKPSPYCTGEPHARNEVIDENMVGTCRYIGQDGRQCGGKRQYPKPSLDSVQPDQFTDAHADNIGRKEHQAQIGFDYMAARRRH